MTTSTTKSRSGWGGNWTEEKLDAFEKYVKAYLTIMNKCRDKYDWKLVYFDGFAGSGSRSSADIEAEVNSTNDLFGADAVDTKELSVYEGAAERVVKLEMSIRGFDYYCFVDLHEENCALLEHRLAKHETRGKKVFRPGDANEEVCKFAEFIHQNPSYKALVLLDPFGMQIHWDTLEQLAGKSVDLWILVPSGVIVNRLLQKNGTLRSPQRLVEFFGMPEEEIHDWFYERAESPSLFGDDPAFQKKDNAIELIAELYNERLGELFTHVTPKGLALRNERRVPIYHFVCASNNKTAVHIAKDIIDKKNRS